MTTLRAHRARLQWFFVAIFLCRTPLAASQIELGVDVTGTHLHKIDEAPTGAGARFLYNFSPYTAFDLEVTGYPGIISALFGTKAGFRRDRFGVFGKSRFGFWRWTSSYFAIDAGGVLEYYPSSHTAVRMDIGDTIIFYGGAQLGTVHNFQPGVGLSYRF
jgi:hypothetical protein